MELFTLVVKRVIEWHQRNEPAHGAFLRRSQNGWSEIINGYSEHDELGIYLGNNLVLGIKTEQH